MAMSSNPAYTQLPSGGVDSTANREMRVAPVSHTGLGHKVDFIGNVERDFASGDLQRRVMYAFHYCHEDHAILVVRHQTKSDLEHGNPGAPTFNRTSEFFNQRGPTAKMMHVGSISGVRGTADVWYDSLSNQFNVDTVS